MKSVVVRYKVKPDRAEENQRLVEAVFQELSQSDPGGLRYAVFKLADGVSFVHVATIESEDGTSPLPGLASFRDFQGGIGARCDEPPIAQDATLVGAYRCFPG